MKKESAMKVVVTTAELLSALKLFKPMSSKVFAIQLTAEETSLQICGHSTTAYLDVTVPARGTGEGDGKAVVLHAELVAAANTFRHKDALILTVDGARLSIADAVKPGEGATVAFQPRVPGRFERPSPNGGTADDQTVPCMTLNGTALAQALACVSPCSTKGVRATNFATGYIHFAARGDRTIEIVGTDSYRLGCYTLSVPSSAPLTGRSEDAGMAGIEGAALAILQTMVTRASEISLGFGKTWGVACTSACVLFFRLSDLKYPEYRRVMERARTEEKGEAVFRRGELADALKKAMAVAGVDTTVYLRQGARADSADMQVVDITSGECIWSTKLDAAALKLPVFRARASYLLQAISAASHATATLVFNTTGGEGPVTVRDGSFTGIVMPKTPSQWEDAESLRQYQDAYSAACLLPRQSSDFLLENADMPVPAPKCRKPSFKAVVDFAQADTAYRRELLAALGVA